MKMWKVYDDDDNDDIDGQRANFDQKSSLEPSVRWAKKASMQFWLGKGLKIVEIVTDAHVQVEA